MARVLRPGSGRAVLLVTQPYLLGLPDIQRERKKDKKAWKRGTTAGMQTHRGTQPERSKPASMYYGGIACETGESGRGNTRRCGSDIAETAVIESVSGVHDTVCEAPFGLDVAAASVDGEANPGAVWRVRDRHSVNVGGLLSWLLILDRTDVPAPPRQSLDRHKRWVGMDVYRTKRRQQQISHPHDGRS